MMVFCENKYGGMDIWIPYKKVRRYIITRIAKEHYCSERVATRILNDFGQEHFERLWYKDIKREFSSFIKVELKEWAIYEKSLEKGKKCNDI